MTAKDLKPGYRGRIAAVGGISPSRRRLIDMGILPGVEIHVLKAAPFGDPYLIRVRGYQLSLRKSELKQIKMEGVHKNERDNRTAWQPKLRQDHAF